MCIRDRALTVTELSEHECHELIPAGEVLDIPAVSYTHLGLQKRVNLMQQTTNSDLSRHYLPRQLRHLILQEYLSGVKTARQLSEEHGIPMSTIHKLGQRWKAKNSCSFVSKMCIRDRSMAILSARSAPSRSNVVFRS